MTIPKFDNQETSVQINGIPKREIDPGLFTHAAIVLTVVIAVAILLALGKIGENSATPLFGAALGIAPRATPKITRDTETEK